MAFVPAGYYDHREEGDDDFDFGDGYEQGQYEVTVIKASDGGSAASLKREDGLGTVEPGEEDEASVPSPEVDGEESFSGSLDASPDSKSPLHVNVNKNNSASSPVRFNLFSSPPESVESLEFGESVVGTMSEPLGSVTMESRRCEISCDRDEEETRGRLSELEMAENMKIALRRGNVEEVARLLDEGI